MTGLIMSVWVRFFVSVFFGVANEMHLTVVALHLLHIVIRSH